MIHIILVIWHWFQEVLGFNIGIPGHTPRWYNGWSGFIGDVTIIGSLIYGSWKIYQNTRCHVDGCNKHGKYPFHHYKLCDDHHPGVPEKITHAHILSLHKLIKEK